MSEIYNTWKGKSKGVTKNNVPTTGMISSGTIVKGRSSGTSITGILVEAYSQHNTAILRCKENFPHCVDYNSLQIVVE